jgi:S-adenosylmethionine/arginine decarboxylase-like enzyme
MLGTVLLRSIYLNVHAQTEDKICDKERLYEELEQVFDKFPRNHMKIFIEDFSAKVGKENIFKPTIWNVSLHKNCNDNAVRVANFITAKNLIVKNAMTSHANIHKFIWTSHDGKRHNQLDYIS